MLELTADRLVLVDGGTATEFAGTLDDYTDFVLGKKPAGGSAASAAPKISRKDERRLAAEARERGQSLRKRAKAAEELVAKLGARGSAIDRAMFDPSSADAADAKLTMTELMKVRAEVAKQLAAAEEEWLELTEILEGEQKAA
jgi:ATP-binding cassette subfamily F protein 3